MYGNTRLPGITVTEPYRPEGSIWRGFTQSTWFRIVTVNGDSATGTPIPIGTIMKEFNDGSYIPMALSDIITGTAGLPGARLVIVADSTGKTGTTETIDGASGPETVKKSNSILVGTMGEVDQDRLIVGDKTWADLDDTQRKGLRTQLEAWNFQPVPVVQA